MENSDAFEKNQKYIAHIYNRFPITVKSGRGEQAGKIFLLIMINAPIKRSFGRYIMNIYEACPTIENGKFILRLVENEDCDDLLRVYSDKNVLPFFNSDNCDGDNFYYATKERMKE